MKIIKKLDYIDALRGIAILGVIIVHTNLYGTTKLPVVLNKMVFEGARGVQLFYLASAFTLFLSYKNRLTKERNPVRNFFLRRFFRIAPMYYLGIIYYLIEENLANRYWIGDETHITYLNIIANCTFLHGFNPYWINRLIPGGWSIGVEMMFYAVVPFIYSKIKGLNQAFNLFLLSLIVRMLLEILLMKFPLISTESTWHEYLFFYFPNQLPIFCMGIILYFILIENESIKNISAKSVLIFSGFILVQLGTDTQYLFPNHLLFGIGFFILAYALSTYSFIGIVNPIINYIGKISFSMYLVHFPILHLLYRFNYVDYFNNSILNYTTRLFIVCILSVLISSILFKIIEVPFQEIGKRIINKLEK